MQQLQPTLGANLFHVHDGKVTKLVLYYNGERALAEFGVGRVRPPRVS